MRIFKMKDIIMRVFKINRMFLYFAPPIFCLLTIIFWILSIKDNEFGYFISTLSIIYVTFLVPVYLIVLNINVKDMKVALKIIFSFTSSILSTAISYFNYGITTNTLFSPDLGTRSIVFYEFVISCGILAIFFVIYFISKLMD
jgi:hypothetical protein